MTGIEASPVRVEVVLTEAEDRFEWKFRKGESNLVGSVVGK